MAAATVVTAWQDGTYAHMAVSVAEGPPLGTVEYMGSTPLYDDAGVQKPIATLKAELVAACKAQRLASQTLFKTSLAISGQVAV